MAWQSQLKAFGSFAFFFEIYLYSASLYSLIEYLVFQSIDISMTPLYQISSYSLWKSLKQGWRSAYFTVKRWLGLKTSIFLRRSRACSSMLGKKELKDRFLTQEIWFKHSWAITDSIDSIYYLVGLPSSQRILSTWFRVEFPGKMAFPKYISPRMQPTDHISTAFVYLLEPRRIYGARYQRVATYSVMMGSGTDWLTEAMDLASPKSASLAKQSESRRILEGLRSLWISSPECMYLMALRTLRQRDIYWYSTYFLCTFSMILARMTA